MSYLQYEIATHPLLEPQDAVKFLFQSAYGCGHLLGDKAERARRIAQEIGQTEADASAPVMSPIGRGLCRLNLRSPIVRALSPHVLARMMKLSEDQLQKEPKARLDLAFEASLGALSALVESGRTPFSAQTLGEYLAAYRAEGCPVVSHTEAYRAAYQPAYRVTLSDFGTLAPVIAAIDRRVQKGGRAIVALDGDCGAGKTTMAELLSRLLGASLIHMDDFFLPFERRTEERRQFPGWNVDYERFLTEAVPGLERGGGFDYRRFDCHQGVFAPRRCEASPVIVIEGSYSHHPSLDESYKRLRVLRAFLGVSEGEQVRRLGLRDPDKLARFQNEWMPLEKTYFMAYDIKGRADIVLQSTPWEGAT